MSTHSSGVNFRMTSTQLQELRSRAQQRGLSVQAYLELEVFGEILQRQVNRRDSKPKTQEAFPISAAS